MTVPGEGPSKARIFILGEAPGREEVMEGRPFVGPSGRLLNRLLEEAGIDRSECYVTNVIQDKLPNNNFRTLYTDGRNQVPSPALVEAQARVRREITEREPNLVVCLGAEALRAVQGLSGLTKWRGSVLWNDEIGAKVLATWHPASIFRAPENRVVAAFDLGKAARKGAFPEYEPPAYDFYLEPSFSQVMDFLGEITPGSRVSFDIETSREDHRVRCLGIARSGSEALVIPFTKSAEPRVQSGSIIGGLGGLHYWGPEEEWAILQEVQRILEDPGVEKIAQNAGFDVSVLAYRWGIRTRGIWMDTMHLAHALYPELPKNLDFLCSLFTDQAYYADRDSSVDMEEWRYNALDCCVTYQVAEVLLEEAKAAGMWEFYTHHIQPAAWALTQMSNRGVRIDQEKRAALRDQVIQDLEKVTQDLVVLGPTRVKRYKTPAHYTYRGTEYPTKGQAEEAARDRAKAEGVKVKDEKALVAPGPLREEVIPFNPGSDQQVQDWLYRILGLPVQRSRKTKNPSTDEEALLKLQTRARSDEEARILRLLLDHRKYAKVLEYLEAPVDSDGRMRTSYNVSGTKNGRISSSRSIWGSGMNLQQVPQRKTPEFRRMFVPDPGMALVKVDLSQAEVRVVAWDAPLPLKARFEHEPDFDVHAWSASQIYRVPEDGVTREQRAKGKIGVHGGNYGLGPRGASAQFNVPYKEAKMALDGYRGALGDHLRAWWSRIEEEIKATRLLSTPMGRRRTFIGRLDESTFRSAYSFIPQAVVGDIINRAAAWSPFVLGPFGAQVLLQVHDELVFQVPVDVLDQVLPRIKALMEPPILFPSGTLVIPSEIGVGPSWKDVKEVDDAALSQVEIPVRPGGEGGHHPSGSPPGSPG